MPYSGRAVANYFLILAAEDGKKITPLKIQKLLYYAHGWYLARYGESLVAEGFQAWPWGPVSPDVYDAFKKFGSKPITELATHIIDIEDDPGYARAVVPPPPESDTRTRKHIKMLWKAYKSLTAGQLSEATHRPGTPWSMVTNGGEIKNLKLQIDNSVIKDYFRPIFEKNLATIKNKQTL